MRLILVGVLFLWGCSTIPLADRLLAEAETCEQETPLNCEEHWAAWADRLAYNKKQREYEAMFDCPDGMMYMCADQYCMAKRAPRNPPRGVDLMRSGCIDAASRDRLIFGY